MRNKKIKYIPAFLSAVLATTVFAFSPISVFAADSTLNVETGIDKSMEIPLTLDADTEDFYINGNINPGDTMRATVYFKNTSTSPIQVRIADVLDEKNDTLSAKLMEVLKLSISMDGSTIYQGNHKDVTSPLTQWIELEGGGIITMNISVEFPKMEADNTFQGAEMHVKYVFEARADVPPDEAEDTGAKKKNNEIIKTGVEDSNTLSSMESVVAMLGASIIVGAGYVVYRKKKDSASTK